MTSLAWIALWMIPVTALALLLWRREARRLQAPLPGPLKALALTGLVLLGGLLYLWLGFRAETAQWLADYRQMRPMVQQLMAGEPARGLDDDTDVRALAMTLQRELARNPSAPGWYTLAMVYNESGRGEPAVEAARRALKLSSPEQKMPARVLLARSLITRADGRLTGEAEEQLRRVLEVNPQHDGAWTLLAVSAARSGRHQVAVEAFEILLERHRDGESRAMLERALERARGQAQRQAAFADLQMTVTAPAQVQPGGTLFIFLRRENGGGQPLAARRYLVGGFPVTLSLRAQDWLQDYPEPGASLVAGARYSSGPGADVESATQVQEAVPLQGEPGRYHAELHLSP